MLMLYTSMIDSPKEKRKFEQVYRNYRQTMYYAANRILRDSYEAEDAVHNAFLRMIDHLDKIHPEDCHKTKALVVIIVESAAIDIYRTRKRTASVPYDEITSAEESYTGQQMDGKIELEAALEALPVHYRTALLLKFSHGYSAREIAGILNITEENVRQRIARAKKKLNQLMGGEPG